MPLQLPKSTLKNVWAATDPSDVVAFRTRVATQDEPAENLLFGEGHGWGLCSNEAASVRALLSALPSPRIIAGIDTRSAAV